MDFNSIKQSLSDAFSTASEKAKEFSEKTLEFAGDHLAKTPLFIDNSEEYSQVLSAKRAVILAFDETSNIEKDILVMLPIWQADSFIDSTTFRYMNKEVSDILLTEKGYKLPIEMRVFFEGKETARFNDLESIKAWWKSDNRDYTGSTTNEMSANTSSNTSLKKTEEKTEEKSILGQTLDVKTEEKIEKNSELAESQDKKAEEKNSVLTETQKDKTEEKSEENAKKEESTIDPLLQK